MKKEQDFSRGHPNPHAARLNTRVVLSMPTDVVSYFQAIADEIGTSYDHIMWVYLRDCATNNRARPEVLRRAVVMGNQEKSSLVVNPKTKK